MIITPKYHWAMRKFLNQWTIGSAALIVALCCAGALLLPKSEVPGNSGRPVPITPASASPSPSPSASPSPIPSPSRSKILGVKASTSPKPKAPAPKPSTQAPTRNIITPGSYCSEHGAYGWSETGNKYRCSLYDNGQWRWKRV